MALGKILATALSALRYTCRQQILRGGVHQNSGDQHQTLPVMPGHTCAVRNQGPVDAKTVGYLK